MTKHILAVALTALATPIWADTIPLSAPVTAATLYADGATLTRVVPFTAPAGTHDLLITNLPDEIDPTTVRIAIDGARLGAVTIRYAKVPPVTETDSAALEAAKADVTRLQDEIRATRDQQADVLMQAEAANARLGYLTRLQSPQDATSPEALSATLAIIGQETLKAGQEAATAERTARSFDETVKDLTEALADAIASVAALTPPEVEKYMLSAAIASDQPIDGTVTLVHRTDYDAYWQPVYDVRLTTGDAPSLKINRNVFVYQETGEDWSEVALTLSTSRPNAQASPTTLAPWRRRIEPPQPVQPKHQGRLAVIDDRAEMSVLEAPMIEETATRTFDDGINATYAYPTPVSINSGTEALRLALDTVDLSPEVYAFANPMRDETAFVVAKMTNTLEELILNGEADFYLNDSFVTHGNLPLVAAGDTTELAFGAIPGLRLSDTVTKKLSGDTGVLTSRNEQTETRVLTAENLTAQSWDLRLIGRVPYSEQKDLVITHKSAPLPTTPQYKDQRGILMWSQKIGAGKTFKVELSHKIQWPPEMILR